MFNREKVAPERRKPHHEGLHYLCSLLRTVRMVTSEKFSSISHFEKCVEIIVENAKGRSFVSDMGAQRCLLLQRVLNRGCNNTEWIKTAYDEDQ